MLFAAVDIIRSELNAFGVTAALGNIGEIVSSTGSNHGTNSDIIISLINIEENRVSRDPQNFLRRDTGIVLKNPAVHLYLTLLFTSVRHESGYGIALQNVQRVIEFFQQKYVFDHSNSVGIDDGIEKLVLDMVSFNMEQLHQLWSMLGGKYHPSVAYRMRMITVDSVSEQQGSMIKEIETYHHLK
jgi:hypothetical protein